MIRATELISLMISLAIRYPGAALPPKMTVRGVTHAAGGPPEPVIKGDQVQHVEVLALVLVQPLHLDVEERLRIHDDVGPLLDEAGQSSLVVGLDGSPLHLKVGVTRHRLDAAGARLPDLPSTRRRCAA